MATISDISWWISAKLIGKLGIPLEVTIEALGLGRGSIINPLVRLSQDYSVT